jgi:AcrR family transcriptional regulator
MAGGRHAGGESGTPRGELTRIRQSRDRDAEETHARILAAMLAACGRKGYRSVAVQDVIEGYGGNRVQFYRQFANKADCYTAAYESEAERLCEAILDAARAKGEWRLGLRAGLDELAGYVESGPLLARGLLVEVHVAGGAALAKRGALCERYARAIDSGRSEAAEASPPPMAAQFLGGAVE